MTNHVYLLNKALELLMKARYIMTQTNNILKLKRSMTQSDADSKQKTG